jgi:hypothetical protein
MTTLHSLIAEIGRSSGCSVAPPTGLPSLRAGDRLPDDLLEFYQICGGVRFFDQSDYPVQIVGPTSLVRSNPVIVRSECPDDITDSWYIVARSGGDEAISIDCHPARLGRCYDSFWDHHGIVGECAVVALSFTELLRRLFENRGGYWYWLGENGFSHGDAYGPIGN